MFTKLQRKDSIFGFVSGTTGLCLPTVSILVETIHFYQIYNNALQIYRWVLDDAHCFTGQSRTFFHSLCQQGMQKICILKAIIQTTCQQNSFPNMLMIIPKLLSNTYQFLPSKNSLNVLQCKKTQNKQKNLLGDSTGKAC